MPIPLHVVVLAAGQGTRMHSALPKVLHPVGGRPMLGHVLETARSLEANAVHVVVGHGADQIEAYLDTRPAGTLRVDSIVQSERLGTAHAVAQALPDVPDTAQVLVLYGDVPLVQPATLQPLLSRRALSLLTTELADPAGYGRILRDEAGGVDGIVEERDATPEQRAIREVNTGILCAPARLLKRWVPRIGNKNVKREFYLTDAVALAVADGVEVSVARAAPDEVLGVNDRAQLAQVERLFQWRQAHGLMRRGLAIADPARFDLRGVIRFDADVTIDVGVILEGSVTLGPNVYVGPYSLLRNVTLGAGTRIESHSVLDGVTAGRNCRIGPFARVRPETELADEVHVGNFVEVKKTRIGKGSKANHLAYLGDGAIGERVNVGAGTIFCNYDGADKHRTVLEDDVFVGSDSQLVAPVTVGKGATIGAGSTITRDVPPGGLTVCRAKEQASFPKWKRPTKKG